MRHPVVAVTLLTSTAQPPAASARSRRAVRPCPGARVPPSPGESAPRVTPRDPGGRSPAGDRAPPRGVDVKPTPRGAREGSQGPGRALEGAPEGLPSRDPGIRALGGPWTALGAQPTGLARGFYINPSRRGPVPAPGSRGPQTSRSRLSRETPEKAPPGPETRKIPLLGPPRGIPGKVPKWGLQGPAARG